MDWWTSDIQQIFYRGRTVVVTDVAQAYPGGRFEWATNHADCVPLADQDTAALKRPTAAAGRGTGGRSGFRSTASGTPRR
jgi:hypothetical protein